MKFTRRSLFGLLGGAAAVKVLPFMPKEAVAEEPTFPIQKMGGPPFAAGDVVRDLESGQVFLVRKPEGSKMRMIFDASRGHGKGIGEKFTYILDKPTDPGYREFRRRTFGEEPKLVCVPMSNLESPQVIPLEMFDNHELVRVGMAHGEAKVKP